MTRWTRFAIAAALVAVLAGTAYFIFRHGADPAEDASQEDLISGLFPNDSGESVRTVQSSTEKAGDEDVADADEEEEEPQTEEEKREAEEGKLVDAFDELTDKWTEPVERGVTMSEVDEFAAAFRKVPKDRQDECIHRALNLIPDENVMLLAGVLMDKTMDRETVETVFNDVLNRDEDVKKPILEQLFKDKTHPCWEDVAWILDVTDELPNSR